MSFTVDKLEKNMVKLTIEVDAAEFAKAMDTAYEKNKNKISVPGFRKGKVPKKMIEKMYGAGIFYEDAANAIIPDAYHKAAEESGLDIVSQPEIDVTQIEEGKNFIFTAEVAVRPEVTLGTYKGVEIAKVSAEVTDEDIEEEVKKVQEQNARIITVEDRPVQDKDDTVIDFEGFVDGVAFEGGKGENYPLTIGSKAFIPGFEEQLVGAELNKEVEVNVTFPEDYQAEELAGKAAVFKCTVKEIKEKELPVLDDEFASEVSEFDTLAEYKEDVKKNLTEKKETEAKNEKEEKVIDAIIADAKMDIPEAMVQTQQRQMAEDFAQRLQMQGLSIDQYFQFTGLTKEAFLNQMKPQAEKRIKTRLVLEAVAEAEKFEVTEEEYKAEVKKMAEAYQMDVEKIEEMIGAYEEKAIKSDISIKKAVDFVVAEAKEIK